MFRTRSRSPRASSVRSNRTRSGAGCATPMPKAGAARWTPNTALRLPGNVVNRNMDQSLDVHASCVPLEKAVLGFDEDPRQYHLGLNWTAECAGMCGV